MGDRTHEPFPFEEETEVEVHLSSLWEGDIPGLLEIGTEGCAGSTHIVVNGATYGKIWMAGELSEFGPMNLSFTEWICAWAERAIPRVIQERVTNSVKIGMSLQEVNAICGDNGHRPYSLSRGYLRFEGLATAFDVTKVVM
jgi:hypothetical protein